MQVQNQRLMPNIPFDEYLAMPGYSYSGIKADGKPFAAPTAKMRFGTLVHTYLLKPREYDHGNPLHSSVKAAAAVLKATLGPLLPAMHAEAICTADFIQDGFLLRYKGQIDLCLPGKLVIDLKVTEQPLEAGIRHFGYDNQITGYCLGSGATRGLLLGVHPRTHLVNLKHITLNPAWWEYQVKQKGEPMLWETTQ